MADKTVTVGPGKTYASLQSALDTERTNNPSLTTDNGTGGPGIITFECYSMQDGATDTGTGWTTNSSYYLVIRGAATERAAGTTGKWSTERYRIVVTDVAGLIYQAHYTQVKDLQVKVTVTTATGRQAYANTGANNTRVERCVAVGDHQGSLTSTSAGYAISSASGTGPHYYINCLAYDFSHAAQGRGFNSNLATTVNWYNCTTYNCHYGFSRSLGTCTATNCGAAASAGAGFNGTITQTPGTCSTATPTFLDEAGDDFHLSGADTTWKDAGDGSTVKSQFTDDIDTYGSRPATDGDWDIGCDEFPSNPVGAPGSVWVEVKL